MDLFLVRHGQPDWAPDHIARNDPDLTDLGREQATRVGHRLSSLPEVDEIWVSPMVRALETSEPVASELGHEREVCDWLKEIQNPAEWEGEPVEVIERAFEHANFREMDEMWDGLPGGESFRDFHQRVVTGLVDTMDTH
ncbi:MAG: histidine phosphatase family protein, partial [Acidimicrobiia bacterium]